MRFRCENQSSPSTNFPKIPAAKAIEIVWETVEFMGNTVIFVLAGLLFADTLLDSFGIIHLADFGWLLVLYVSLLVIRCIMLAVLWIPLQKVGSPIDWREGVAMVWSGLRGAVSLTLAIIIDEEPAITREMGARIMFHCGGIAALTLLVNAATAAPLLRYLGLARSSGADQRKLKVLSKHLAQHTQEIKGQRDAEDLRFQGINEAMLQAMVPSLVPHAEEAEASDEKETAQAYREAFLQVVKSHYWSSIHQGLLPRTSQTALLLVSSVDVALENATESLTDWKAVYTSFQPVTGTINSRLRKIVSVLSGEHSMGELMQKAYCVLSFMEAHRRAREELPRFFHGDDIKVQRQVSEESLAECLEAEVILKAIPEDLVVLARTEMLARKLLQEQLHEVDELKERGLLTSADASKLGHHVQSELVTLLHRPQNEWLALRS